MVSDVFKKLSDLLLAVGIGSDVDLVGNDDVRKIRFLQVTLRLVSATSARCRNDAGMMSGPSTQTLPPTPQCAVSASAEQSTPVLSTARY
jgi:hypothetical protein